jgi:outer membrane protein OmpA-like peptidoglycan-associated protein
MLAAVLAPVSACGPQRISGPAEPEQDIVVLLADADTGAVGSAVVSNSSGATTLSAARDATSVVAGKAPGAATALSESDVQRLFGDALSALAAPPRRFTLYFELKSDDLTAESRELVPEVLKLVQERPAADVTVVGHTDTTGSPEANAALGLKRATMVRNMLLKAGVADSVIEVTSHGEADLLVQTPDNTAEARNRRVEIAVR